MGTNTPFSTAWLFDDEDENEKILPRPIILSALKAPLKELKCPAMPRSRRQNPWNEVVGLAALGIGTVVF
ncbi:MAG: hypothetical protein WBZ19_22470, partial [Chthoniobacterales bacterium]